MDRPRFPWLQFGAGVAAILVGVLAISAIVELLVSPTIAGVQLVHAVRIVVACLLTFLLGRRLLMREYERAEAARQEAQRTQALMETALGHLPLGVYICDAEGRAVYLNARGAEILGQGLRPDAAPAELSHAYQTYRRGTEQLYPTEELPVMRVLRGERRVVADDLEVRRPDRTVPERVWADAVVVDGRVAYAVAVFADITQQLEDERRRAQLAQAQELGSMRRRFLNMAAHELYTPLTPLRLQLAALVKAPTRTDVAATARVLQRNVDRIHGVVSRILRVMQLEAEAEKVREDSLDLAEVVDAAVGEIRARAEDAGVTLALDASPVKVAGDAAKLEDAVFNLLDNAVKFAFAGVHVAVTVRREGDEAIVEVLDDGPGFDPDDRLFEPFHRVLSAGEGRTREGWGLGLHITKIIVSAHGGRVWVESEGAGTGTRAGFAIPTRA